MTNPDGDYKDLTTIIRKAECFSGAAVLEKPVTKEIQSLPLPARTPVVAIYKFEDLTGQRKRQDGQRTKEALEENVRSIPVVP